MSYGRGCSCLSPCSKEDVLGILNGLGLSPRSILDVGCGRGERLAFFGEKFPSARLVGLEPDAENAALSRENCPGAEIAEKSAESYAGASAELTLCECVFSLFPDPEAGAEALCRLTERGGTLLLSDLFIPDGAGESTHLADEGVLRNIYVKSELEGFFVRRGFELLKFYDRSGDMLSMACQMVMGGTFCESVGAESFAFLRRARAGYGVWVMRHGD